MFYFLRVAVVSVSLHSIKKNLTKVSLWHFHTKFGLIDFFLLFYSSPSLSPLPVVPSRTQYTPFGFKFSCVLFSSVPSFLLLSSTRKHTHTHTPKARLLEKACSICHSESNIQIHPFSHKFHTFLVLSAT